VIMRSSRHHSQAVIARERRAIQYSETSMMESEGSGVLDTRRSLSSGGHSADPLAGMTPQAKAAQCSAPLIYHPLVVGAVERECRTSISNRSPLSLTIW